MVLRAVPTLLMTVGLVLAAVVAIGAPDLGLAGSFLGGSYPTEAASLALVGLILWVLIAAAALAMITGSLRAVSDSEQLRHRSTRAGVMLAAGLLVLGMGIFHRHTAGYSICCGSGAQQLQEASQLAR